MTRTTLNGGEAPSPYDTRRQFTIAEACDLIGRRYPATEGDLDRLAYDLPSYNIRTNVDDEPFWRLAKERERLRRLVLVARGGGDDPWTDD